MVRSLVWLGVVAVAGFGGLRFAEAVANVDVAVVQLEGELTAPEKKAVQNAVANVLAKPGPHRAGEVAAAIEAIGWVRQVQVRKRWPDALHVSVVRDTLAASWGADAYLTTGGDVVPVSSGAGIGPNPDLPVLSSSLSDGTETMRVFNLLNALVRASGLRIVRLDEDRVGNWTVTFADGPEVVLGSVALRERLDRFLVVHSRELVDAPDRAVRVDARYHAGVAVRWASARDEQQL